MSEQQPVQDSIVRKIQLLLNLGSRSQGNEAEAAAAMAKAQELLAQHNLDLATVQDKVVAGGTAEREQETKRDYAVTKRSAMYKWQQNLVRAIAEANFCAYWVTEVNEKKYVPPSKRKLPDYHYDKGGKATLRVKRHQVLGRVANTTAVMIMTDYLLDTIERLLPYPQNERLSADANLWREGCADRLVERIRAKAEAMRTPDYARQGEAAYCTAIQVADLAKKEEAGNYDFIHGEGAWARRLAREAEYNSPAAIALRKESEELAAKKEAERLANETPAERIKRLKKEAADDAYWERYWAREDARDARDSARRSARRCTGAYRAGHRKGAEIGLNDQLDKGKETPKLG